MYCTESCDRSVCRGCQSPDKMVRFSASSTQQHPLSQTPQQRVPVQQTPKFDMQQYQLPLMAMPQQGGRQQPSCVSCSSVVVPDPGCMCDVEPRVGMCFVSEGPDGLSIDCNVPIPSSFNIDALKSYSSSNVRAPETPQNNECCVSCMACGPMPQLSGNCMSMPVPIPVLCSCFDQMQPTTSASLRDSGDYPIEPPPVNTPPPSIRSTAVDMHPDAETFQRLLQQQQQQISYFMDCSCYSIQPSEQDTCCCDMRPQPQSQPQPQQPPSATQTAPAPMLRLDLPCLLTQPRTDNNCCEPQKQTPVSLQLFAPLNQSAISACPPVNTSPTAPIVAQATASCQTYSTSTPHQMDGNKDVSSASQLRNLNQNRYQNRYQSLNQNQSPNPSPPPHGPPPRQQANACKKCIMQKMYHYPRYPSCFYHPGVLRLYPDKNCFYNLWR